MESFALILFVLCTCAGLLSVALMARWLRKQSRSAPDVTLDTLPAERVVEPLAASAGAAHAARHLSVQADDEPTQPMTRTQTWDPVEPARGHSDWPTTVLDESHRPSSAEHEKVPADGFADTQPMPVTSV